MKDIIYVISIFATFLLGLWNIINNYRNSRRTSFINTITSERINWIERLRKNISDFCGFTYTWCLSGLSGSQSELDYVTKIDNLRHLIRLQLNPQGTHDCAIEKLISEIPDLTDITKREELKIKLNELIKITQLLLKEEWDKVKLESKMGDLKDNKFFADP
ncbi:MAG: hypothetical protein V1747_10955 [Candidatus Omnitrophota bacterium]